LVSDTLHPQTIDVLLTRAEPLEITIKKGNPDSFEFTDDVFGIILQYPDTLGAVTNYTALAEKAHAAGVLVAAATDLMSLLLLKAPGEWGADVAFGSAQRLGVPMGYGGPHAAFFATKEEYKREIPGRLIGVSVDAHGNKAYRMALQTREQHIRREKATSNICTAQALLSIMAGMYAAYHGPQGIKAIAQRVHGATQILARNLQTLGYVQKNQHYFDTLLIETEPNTQQAIQTTALAAGINFHYPVGAVQITLDETVLASDLQDIVGVFAQVMHWML
jgi:glycine dehydrogenase